MGQNEMKPDLKTPIITAVVMGLVTAFVTIGVMTYQLPKEHQYWIDKQEHLRELKILDTQLKLVEGLTQELSDLQNLRWQANILAIHYLALDMLADRHGQEYAKDLREKISKDLSHTRDKFAAKLSKINARFMMGRLIFASLRISSDANNKDPLDDFQKYFPSAEFVITTDHMPQLRIVLAQLPELAGKPNPALVEKKLEKFILVTITPGHRRFYKLSNTLLQHMGKEIYMHSP